MPVATGVLIDGPAPQAPLYTLPGAAQVVAEGVDEHYLLGAAVRGYPSVPAHTWEWCGHLGDDGLNSKIIVAGFPTPTFEGFSVYFAEECNLRGVGAEAFAERVEAIFPAVEAYAVEREFYAGLATPTNPHLTGAIPIPGGADQTIFPAGNAAQTLVEGVALLEGAIALTGRRGMIHMSPTAFTHLVRSGTGVVAATRSTPPQLQTMLGTTIVPGYGYQAAATIIEGSTPIPPAGHPAPTGTQEWIYATGPIEIRRSADVEIVPDPTEASLWQAVDRANDLIRYEAIRHYLLTWDAGFKAAVMIDRAT